MGSTGVGSCFDGAAGGEQDTCMISTVEGRYSLDELAGTYKFDKATCMLSAKDDETAECINIGPFLFAPIQPTPLPEPESFDKLRLLCERARGETEGDFICNSEIMAEIQKETNDGALFVLPSQLNGAEYPSHNSVVKQVEEYMYDNTGGPRGQLAAHPAAAQFVLDNAAHEKRKDGINAVDELEKTPGCGVRLHNGYLEVQEVADLKGSEAAFQSKLHTLRPLIMEDIPAVGLTPSKRSLNAGKHRVGLVYASAVPVNTYLNRVQKKEQLDHQNFIAACVLRAQYYGALKHAARKAEASKTRRKVYLMPLGGGVFNNSWELIARSMATAIEMLEDREFESLEIHPLTWSGSPKEKTSLEVTFKALLQK